jgi:hypothetical protein
MTFLKRSIPGFRMGALLLALQTLAVRSFAAPAGGGLPWEKPMTLIATSLKGLSRNNVTTQGTFRGMIL